MLSPDPLLHFKFSMAKSIVRILAGGCGLAAAIQLVSLPLVLFAGLLIFAEMLGIFEELF